MVIAAREDFVARGILPVTGHGPDGRATGSSVTVPLPAGRLEEMLGTIVDTLQGVRYSEIGVLEQTFL